MPIIRSIQIFSNFILIFRTFSITHPHSLFCNIYEFYLIFCDFISSSIIYNNYLYSRWHFPFWFCLVPDLLILSHMLCPELKSRPCMRSECLMHRSRVYAHWTTQYLPLLSAWQSLRGWAFFYFLIIILLIKNVVK